LIALTDNPDELAHCGWRAVIGSTEIRRGFALNRAGIIIRIQTHFSSGAGQHGLLTVFDDLMMTHHESASLILSRHLSGLMVFIDGFLRESFFSCFYYKGKFCKKCYKTIDFYKNLHKSLGSSETLVLWWILGAGLELPKPVD
jgi:hypothetical protein